MRKTALGLSAALLASVFAGPAAADVFAFADIFKDENVTITEDIDINKDIDVLVTMGTRVLRGNGTLLRVDNIEVNGAAEASAFTNQRIGTEANQGEEADSPNSVNVDLVTPLEFDADLNVRAAIILNSVLDNSGIVGVNQDVGNMNNQGNVVSLAYTQVDGGIAHSLAGTDQRTQNGTLETAPVEAITAFTPEQIANPASIPPLSGAFSTVALIIDSVNDNTGIVGVNQSAGMMNNQSNGVAVAVGEDPVFALSEGALGQVNAHNSLEATNEVKTSRIQQSVNDNVGIVGVNQSSGHFNNQASAVSLGVGVAGTTLAMGALTANAGGNP